MWFTERNTGMLNHRRKKQMYIYIYFVSRSGGFHWENVMNTYDASKVFGGLAS